MNMPKESKIMVVYGIVLVVCIFMTWMSIHYQEEASMWRDNYRTMNMLADSCIDNAPEEDCSWMTYPSHRWDYDNGLWVCNEAHMTGDEYGKR